MSDARIFSKRDELASFLRGHTLESPTGGIATGSYCKCSCGEENRVDSTREMAWLMARRHLADVILAHLRAVT